MKVMRPSVVTACDVENAAKVGIRSDHRPRLGDVCKRSADCGGEPELLESGQTHLHVVGCDPNEHREVYRCTSCGSVVERAFKWRLVKEGGKR